MKLILVLLFLISFRRAASQSIDTGSLPALSDSVEWINIKTDSGVIHAAVAIPAGKGPFPAIIILHGTHGFAREYVRLAQEFAKKGIVGIAACWFAGRKGGGQHFITPIDFNDAPPLVDAGEDRFRIARVSIDSVILKVLTLPYVKKNKIALFGHSRGGGASLNYVLAHPGKVQAVILNSTGYPPDVIRRVSELNIPILMIHGIEDNPAEGGSPLSNIEMARQFESAMRTAKKDIQVKYFEGSGHNALFTDSVQFDQTVKQVVSFLRKKFSH